jgi:mannose-1-phosphate guanylyltransferase/mannose-6-phosphate isomerase
VARGLPAAEAGHIVTFGIRPGHPATGYGYISPGDELPGLAGVNSIAAFVEKPDRATAEHYVAAGYLWNSGNFLFSARTFLDELAALQPDIAGPVGEAVDKARTDLDFLRLDETAFGRSVAKSVDYAVMEKTTRAAVVPSDFAWSDIGAWNAIWELAAKDGDGNAAQGDAVFVDCADSYVHAPDVLTAVVGLENVVVVTTRDAVLVADRRRSEDVKALVARLTKDGRKEAVEHLRSYRPWGSLEAIDAGRRYQVKRITVTPGAKLSLQSHIHRSEHWVVVSGTARVTVGDDTRLLGENQSIYIPLGQRHRLENPGRIPLELIEVQSGAYLAEDDVVRHDDVYGRK